MNLTGWNYLGCYNESTRGRALSGLENPIPGMNNSVEACSMACNGWTYFGVEYGEYILSYLGYSTGRDGSYGKVIVLLGLN